MHKDCVESPTTKRENKRKQREKKQGVKWPSPALGDFVFVARVVKHPNKLSLHWKGPYRVVQVKSDHLMEVQQLVSPHVSSLHHASRLKLYSEAERDVAEDLPEQVAFGDSGFHVEALEEIRDNAGRSEVKVKWLGLDEAKALILLFTVSAKPPVIHEDVARWPKADTSGSTRPSPGPHANDVLVLARWSPEPLQMGPSMQYVASPSTLTGVHVGGTMTAVVAGIVVELVQLPFWVVDGVEVVETGSDGFALVVVGALVGYVGVDGVGVEGLEVPGVAVVGVDGFEVVGVTGAADVGVTGAAVVIGAAVVVAVVVVVGLTGAGVEGGLVGLGLVTFTLAIQVRIMVSYVTKLAVASAVVAAVAQAQAADNCGGVAERPPTAELQIISYNDVYEMKPYDDGNGILVGGPSHVVPLAKTLRKNYEN
ncbi:hypothetical protein DYB32_008930, partial [Aphanomyces invadans]